MMSDELKQVDVRLKLVEGNGVYKIGRASCRERV